MFEGKPFKGEVALITGGGTGLGRAMAMKLAAHGAKVIIASRKMDKLEATTKEIQDAGGECEPYQIDIREHLKVEQMANDIVAKHGKIDILINNAAGNFAFQSEKLSFNQWNSIVGIVLHGTWHCTQHVGRHMLEKKRGKILSIIATYAWTGAPMVMPSAAAKAGVLAMMRSLAIEWGPRGVRLNCIAPGAIITENASKNLGFDTPEAQEAIKKVNPLGRLGTQEELANLAAYLVSDFSGYMNGDVISMDGGQWIASGTRFGRG